jgi:hypothetical protein
MLLDLLLLQSWSLTDLIALGDQTDAPVRRGRLAPAHRRRTASRIHRAIGMDQAISGAACGPGEKGDSGTAAGGAGTGSHRQIRSPNASLARRWSKHGEAMRESAAPVTATQQAYRPPRRKHKPVVCGDATHIQGRSKRDQSHTWRGQGRSGASLVETLSECSLFSLANRTGPDPEYTPPHARHVSCGLHARRS